MYVDFNQFLMTICPNAEQFPEDSLAFAGQKHSDFSWQDFRDAVGLVKGQTINNNFYLPFVFGENHPKSETLNAKVSKARAKLRKLDYFACGGRKNCECKGLECRAEPGWLLEPTAIEDAEKQMDATENLQ